MHLPLIETSNKHLNALCTCCLCCIAMDDYTRDMRNAGSVASAASSSAALKSDDIGGELIPRERIARPTAWPICRPRLTPSRRITGLSGLPRLRREGQLTGLRTNASWQLCFKSRGQCRQPSRLSGCPCDRLTCLSNLGILDWVHLV